VDDRDNLHGFLSFSVLLAAESVIDTGFLGILGISLLIMVLMNRRCATADPRRMILPP
jgi:hypothetical protein